MSIWENERISNNITWISQCLYNGGVKELETWLETQEQSTKDDVVQLVNHLAKYIEKKCEHTVDGALPYKKGSLLHLKPQLRLVNDHDEGELSTSD
jgi:hypothetical protein